MYGEEQYSIWYYLLWKIYEEALGNIVVFLSLMSYSRRVFHTAKRSRRRCSVPARMMSHKLWTVGKILQYCLWYNKCIHLKLRLEEKAKCLGIIAVCGPPELVGYQARESVFQWFRQVGVV